MSSAPAPTAARVAGELRRMIIAGELLPGQPVRQEHMAAQLGVSRLPVREALRLLSADGLVSHVHNVGYTVTRLRREDFAQIYAMRQLLESELVRDLPRATPGQLAQIEALGAQVADAAGPPEADAADVAAMRARNHAFHLAIFRLSPRALIVAEIERLWNLAAPYHAMYLYSADARRAVVAEHEVIIAALRAGDNAKLAAVLDAHRRGPEVHLFAG